MVLTDPDCIHGGQLTDVWLAVVGRVQRAGKRTLKKPSITQTRPAAMLSDLFFVDDLDQISP